MSLIQYCVTRRNNRIARRMFRHYAYKPCRSCVFYVDREDNYPPEVIWITCTRCNWGNE